MLSTAKENCNIAADILISHGVRQFVISPGTRNAPLIVAISRREDVKTWVIIDERSAAFVALGIAQQTNNPVGLVCTSGTALLNYAPAIAEAFYQKVPLIIISADRPMEWIDQDDSQTINQFRVLNSIVKRSYRIPYRCTDDTARWYINRTINDAVIEATTCTRGPVHINIEISEPINEQAECSQNQRIICQPGTIQYLTEDSLKSLLIDRSILKRIMIVVGFGNADKDLQKVLCELSHYPNIAIITESVSNIVGESFINAVDKTLLAMPEGKRCNYAPDLLITLGGALVSSMLKKFLRTSVIKRHWYIGNSQNIIDCFQHLTHQIPIKPIDFFQQIAPRLNYESDYNGLWSQLKSDGVRRHNLKIVKTDWSDLMAFSMIAPLIPATVRLQLSNGMTIRYAQLFADVIKAKSIHCNRGVSGIDGSTSTALGASLTSDDITLLITGDMSFSYDLSGLNSQYNSKRLKIIVMSNGGGGIFKFIKNTSY